MAYEFKKLSDVAIVDTPADIANVLIEEDGVIKKVAKGEIGGGVKVASTASVGQTIVVKAVDENDKPIEWECVDIVQADMVQNDDTAPDYVKNRLAWTDDPVETVIFDEVSHTWPNGGMYEGFQIEINQPIIYGQLCKIYFDGELYECIACQAHEGNEVVIGNSEISPFSAPCGNNEPFAILYSEGECGIFVQNAGTHTVKMIADVEEIHHIDEKYLPESIVNHIGNLHSMVYEAMSLASSASSKANNVQTTVNKKMDTINPTGTGSFSLNRTADTDIGSNSFVAGENNAATKSNTFAVGQDCLSNALAACAVGRGTTANGNYSFVLGRYNILDTATVDKATGMRQFACIIGNGASDTQRENVFTVSWTGTPWSQERPIFGKSDTSATGSAMGYQTVMANGDTEIILKSSTPGSTKQFKITVDDSGIITATEVTA